MNIPGYDLKREIGRGKAATVYLATQNDSGREVALKVLAPGLTLDPGFTGSLNKEMGKVIRLRHKSLLQTIATGASGSGCYIVSEYIAGGNLRQRISQLPDCSQVLSITRQVAEALAYLHEKGHIHGAVKPENILLTDDGCSALLADAGLSAVLEKNVIAANLGLMASPEYLSPEQLLDSRYDDRVDQYALGAVLFECLTGRPVYTGEDPLDIARRQATAPVPSLPERHAVFQPLLNVLLAKDPAHRFASDKAMLAAIADTERAYLSGSGAGAGHAGAGVAHDAPAQLSFTPQPVKTPAWRKVSLAFASVVLMAGTAYLVQPLWSSPARPAPKYSFASVTDSVASVTGPADASTAGDESGKAQDMGKAALPPLDLISDSAGQPVNSAGEAGASSTDGIGPQMQQHIAELLAVAERQIARHRLTTPAQDNAYSTYQQILALDPYHPQALAGIERIAQTYAGLAQKWLRRGNYEKSLKFVNRGLGLSPNEASLLALRAEIDSVYAAARETEQQPMQTQQSAAPQPAAVTAQAQQASSEFTISWRRNAALADNEILSPGAVYAGARLKGRRDIR